MDGSSPANFYFPPNQQRTFVASVKDVSLYDKSLDLREYIFWEKNFLVNLTSAVYISSSDFTLTFGAKSEGSLCAFSLWNTDEDGV